jgi:hypothetical protein
MEVDKFLTYILEKYFVFHPLAELDESNTIDDIEILKREIDTKKVKRTDASMIELSKKVFEKFRCYNIGILNETCNILGGTDAENAYILYKRYKSSSKKVEKEEECCNSSKIRIDMNVNTKDTFYVGSLDTISTEDLKRVFGEYMCMGNENDDYRYEYKFVYDNLYNFSLYDYKNDQGNFYDEKDIYWHIASNTDKKQVYKSFKNELINKIIDT